jgi:hypothetical protein
METIKEILDLLRDLGVFGLAMWFIQMLLSKSADKKVESYKAELDQKTKEFQFFLDSKIESYKIELVLQNYKATKVYEQQLNIIIELHRKLTKLNSNMAIISVVLMKDIIEKTDETERKVQDKLASAIITYDDLLSFYQNNLIFIPQSIIDLISNVLGEYSRNITSYIERRGTENDITFQQALESSQKIISETKQAIDLLTFEFKSLLGVEKHK